MRPRDWSAQTGGDGIPTAVSRPFPSAVADMAVATLFFALMSFCVKWAAPLPVMQIVFFRAVIALALCLVQLRWMGVSVLGTHRKLLFLRGLFGSLALMAYFWSISTLPLATASVLQMTSPIFTVLLGIAVLGERPRWLQGLFFALAAVGVVLMRGLGAGGTTLGVTIALSGAILSAGAYTTIARIGAREHPLVIVAWFPIVTVPLVLPMMPSIWQWPTPRQWVAVISIGIAVQIAQVFMTRAYQRGPTSVVSLVSYLGVVWAAAGGWFLFDEPLTRGLLVGGSLIVVAVIGTSRLRATRPPRPQ